ncbi:MAG: ABC transporter permease, partial [Acidobacteriota bacterium]
MLSAFRQDVRYAFRLLVHSPLFTLTAALSLAIGIGANTTIFSIASAMLLRPLPGLSNPGRVVDVGRTQDGRGFDTVSYPNYLDLRARTTSLAGLYAYRVEPQPMSLATTGDTVRIYGAVVSANYFEVLGTRAELGRLLQDGDDHPDRSHAVAVLSHDLWSRQFAADPALAGRTISLNGHPFTVVGIASPGFQGTTMMKADVWTPISAVGTAAPRIGDNILEHRRSVWLFMGGRLRDGVTLGQANAELQTIGANLQREYPDQNRGQNFAAAATALIPGQTSTVAGFLALLMAIVSLVLLIACVNVAGMLLARAAARRKEVAVRLAIGASRGRLIRQLLTESLILFAAAGLIGLLLTQWFTSLLLALLPRLPVPVGVAFGTDWRVVTFAVVVSLAAAVLSGLAPALQASRADLVPSLKADGFDGGPSRLRLRNAFVIGQVTMSLMLLIVAGLFLRALEHAAAIEPGFDERRVDVVQLDLSLAGYTKDSGQPFVRELLERTRALPGVESATLTVDLPLDGGRLGLGGIKLPGKTPPLGEFFLADWNVAEPGLFITLKLPVSRGRDFTAADTSTSLPVAIVNEALAAQYWPGEDPLGQQMIVDGPGGARTLSVVGVAADARLIRLTGPVEPCIYVPFAQNFMARAALLVRTAGDRSAVPDVRSILRTMNPSLPITEALPLGDVTAIGQIPQRIAAAVAGTLGLVGLLLAAIGIYGVTAYAVSRRTREIGIRIALGADSRSVIRLVLRQGLGLAAIGAVIGVAIAAAGSRFLE